MIDRSYLPYQSARTFQDRGMAKWAGFFLSEHTSALQKKQIALDEFDRLTAKEKIFLLNQAYMQQSPILISYFKKEEIHSALGTVFRLSFQEVLIQDGQQYTSISLDSLLSIHPLGGSDEPSYLPL